MKPLPFVLVAAAVAGAAAAGVGQDRATVGTFLDVDSRPVANATVTFATSDPVVFDAFAPAELVTATTDERGRFRVRLRTGRAYSAWAVQPHEVDEPARSKVYEGIVAGNVVAMSVAERGARQDLVLDGFGQFAALGDGPFSLRLRCDARHGPSWSLPIARDGRVALPPLPAGDLVGRVVDADGNVVDHVLSFVGRKAFFQKRTEVTLQVRDEHGEPVAGAITELLVQDRVAAQELRFGSPRLLTARIGLGVSDANGTVTALVPGDNVYCIARRGAEQARVAGGIGPLAIADGVLEIGKNTAYQLGKQPIELKLRAAPVLRGVLRRAGEPLVDVGVHCFGETILRSASGESSTDISYACTARTDGDGAFVVEDLPRPVGTILLGVEPRVADEPVLLRIRDAIPAQPLQIDLDRFATTTIQCTVAGGPPGDVRVSWWSHEEAEPVVLVGDRAGRVTVRAELGEWLVFATDGEHGELRLLELAADQERTIPFAMAPLAVMSGRVVGPEGRPRAGVGFVMSGVMWQSLDDPTNDESWLRGLADDVNRSLTLGTRTDRDGRFTIRFVDVPGFEFFGWFSEVRQRVTLAAETGVVLTSKN